MAQIFAGLQGLEMARIPLHNRICLAKPHLGGPWCTASKRSILVALPRVWGSWRDGPISQKFIHALHDYVRPFLTVSLVGTRLNNRVVMTPAKMMIFGLLEQVPPTFPNPVIGVRL
jgi:hypothetical protein